MGVLEKINFGHPALIDRALGRAKTGSKKGAWHRKIPPYGSYGHEWVKCAGMVHRNGHEIFMLGPSTFRTSATGLHLYSAVELL